MPSDNTYATETETDVSSKVSAIGAEAVEGTTYSATRVQREAPDASQAANTAQSYIDTSKENVDYAATQASEALDTAPKPRPIVPSHTSSYPQAGGQVHHQPLPPPPHHPGQTHAALENLERDAKATTDAAVKEGEKDVTEATATYLEQALSLADLGISTAQSYISVGQEKLAAQTEHGRPGHPAPTGLAGTFASTAHQALEAANRGLGLAQQTLHEKVPHPHPHLGQQYGQQQRHGYSSTAPGKPVSQHLYEAAGAAHAAVKPHVDYAVSAAQPHIDAARSAVRPHVDAVVAGVQAQLNAATSGAIGAETTETTVQSSAPATSAGSGAIGAENPEESAQKAAAQASGGAVGALSSEAQDAAPPTTTQAPADY